MSNISKVLALYCNIFISFLYGLVFVFSRAISDFVTLLCFLYPIRFPAVFSFVKYQFLHPLHLYSCCPTQYLNTCYFISFLDCSYFYYYCSHHFISLLIPLMNCSLSLLSLSLYSHSQVAYPFFSTFLLFYYHLAILQ